MAGHSIASAPMANMGRHGVRAEWEAIPTPVRDAIDRAAGSPVITATNLVGGFSPGPAARCALADGRTVFVKACGLELNEHSVGTHRREAQVLAGLPSDAPTPLLIDVIDDAGWVALIVEWIEGRMPVAPLPPTDIDRLLRLLDHIGIEVDDASLPTFAEANVGLGDHWRNVVEESPGSLDAWSRRHAAALADIASEVDGAVTGSVLVHGDYRTDNVVFHATDESRDVVVDWPSASVGAPWIDLVTLLPALHLDGGPEPEVLWRQHPLYRSTDPAAIDSFIAAVAGCFTRRSHEPPPPGLPTVRQFQAAQGAIARRWIAERLGLE